MTYFLKRNLLTVAGFVVIGLSFTIQSFAADKSQGESVANSDSAKNLALWPQPISKVSKDPIIEQKIEALLAKMTLEQKVGQTIQAEIKSVKPADVTKYGLGSILNGGGAYPNNNKFSTAQDWVDLADSFYKASMVPAANGVAIPIMWGTDAVHGHNNVMGATLFPHNIALGATHNPELMKKIGAATASEIAATGITWDFAPTIAVARNDRWGRTYESYSENPEIVKAYAGKMVEGIQGTANSSEFLNTSHVLATAKHYLGDGGTDNGVDQGNTIVSEEELVKIHAQGYVSAIEAGVQTVMSSFSSWNGVKMHGNSYLLTDVLKIRMGFDGLVVGDWNGHEFIPGCKKNDCPAALNAGLDIYMVPDDWKLLYENTLAEVKNGVISQARLDDAVRRILRVKLRAGLFENGAPSAHPLAGKKEVIGSAEHRAIARQAVRESLVLLKNKNSVLPINAGSTILVAGDGADNIGKQAGGWSITWQGTGNANKDFPGATSIYQGIADAANANGSKVSLSVNGEFTAKPDVAVVVFGENPYAEGQGDIAKVIFQGEKELALLRKFKQNNIPVVSVFLSGRPLWVNPLINASDAFVAAWLPGTEGAGVADVLLAKTKKNANFDFTGKLSFSWPATPDQTPLNKGQIDYAPLFPYGFGLSYSSQDKSADQLPETFAESKKAIATIEIFKSRSIDPWKFLLKDDQNNTKLVTASVESIGSVSFRTIDRVIQEDSLLIQWSGKKKASAYFASNEATNVSEVPDNAALVFEYRLDKKPTADVLIGMDCGNNCAAEKSIAKALKGAALGKWQTLSIGLNCFNNIKMESVVSPFSISTAGEVTIALHHVRIESATSSTISCH